MKFGSLRHRVLLMKPTGTTLNSMNEKVPAYEVYHPGLKLLVIEECHEGTQVYWRQVDNGNADLIKDRKGKPFAHVLSESEYAYWANVEPTTGREYVEMQKIRAETTYKVQMRFIPGITHDMYLLFNGRKLEIESILNVGERNKELTLICVEVMPSGAQ